jgi:hypothetical protein
MRVLGLLLLIAVLLTLSSSKQMKLLRNVETEFSKMSAAYSSGDTSLAFSIAVKVHFAI